MYIQDVCGPAGIKCERNCQFIFFDENTVRALKNSSIRLNIGPQHRYKCYDLGMNNSANWLLKSMILIHTVTSVIRWGRMT